MLAYLTLFVTSHCLFDTDAVAVILAKTRSAFTTRSSDEVSRHTITADAHIAVDLCDTFWRWWQRVSWWLAREWGRWGVGG